MSRKIHCSILTPEKSLFEGEIAFAVVQAYDGELGVLFNHAPLISELGVGEVRLNDDNISESYVVEGGIVEVKNNKMIILAENATKTEELQPEEIKSRLNEIQIMEFERFSKDRLIIQAEEHRLKMKLKVFNRYNK